MVISLGSNRNIIYYIGPICLRNSNSNRDNRSNSNCNKIILLFCVIDPSLFETVNQVPVTALRDLLSTMCIAFW